MEQNTEKTQAKRGPGKKVWLAVLALAAVIAVLLGVYFATRKPASAGEKTIGVAVVLADGSETDTSIQTDEEYLRGALEQEKMIEGTESSYGLFVTTVNGVAADDSKQEWWCFTKDGATLETGVDTTPIADGDHYEITLTTGYPAA